MAKKYYIIRSMDTTGHKEWAVLTGQEFLLFCKDPGNAGRHFADMGDFVIEMTDGEYADWRSNENHSDYLRSQEAGYATLSLYSDQINEQGNGEEIIPDDAVDVEASAILGILSESLRVSLRKLDARSYSVIYSLYLAEDRKSEREIAERFGVTQQFISKQKKKILEILRKSVVKDEKSQQ